MKKSYKGLYRPSNPKKYVGDVTKIVYRSLLERKFMLYCDRNPDITYWASEELSIRYYNPLDKKYHSYYPDFIVRTIKGDKILVEIKPSRQTKPPKAPSAKDLLEAGDDFDIGDYLDEQIGVNATMNNILKSTLQRFDNTYGSTSNQSIDNSIIISENNSSEEDKDET